jgi:hypothetical protein
MSNALRDMGLVHWAQGDYPEARPAFERSLTLAREAGEVRLEASHLVRLQPVVDIGGPRLGVRMGLRRGAAHGTAVCRPAQPCASEPTDDLVVVRVCHLSP